MEPAAPPQAEAKKPADSEGFNNTIRLLAELYDKLQPNPKLKLDVNNLNLDHLSIPESETVTTAADNLFNNCDEKGQIDKNR